MPNVTLLIRKTQNIRQFPLITTKVVVFNRYAATGKLTFFETHEDNQPGIYGLSGATFVSVSPDGKNVSTVAIGDNTIALFSRNTSTGALTFVTAYKDNEGSINGLEEVIHGLQVVGSQ